MKDDPMTDPQTDPYRQLAMKWKDELEQKDAEIERLAELLRGVGANRYWEGRWRDTEAALRQIELNTRTGDAKTLKLNWIAREALTGRKGDE
jgi:hypothetical protein